MNGPEERKVKSLGELPVAIEPPRDLWPGIEARLNAPVATVAAVSPRPAGARLAQLRWLAAAAMVASVAVGVWIGREVLPLSCGAATAPQSAVRLDWKKPIASFPCSLILPLRIPPVRRL